MAQARLLVLILAATLQPASTSTRLASYEAAVAATGKADPQALAAIATDVITVARRSPKFVVWSEACAATAVPDGQQCATRLRAVLNRPTERTATRAEAASALITRGDTLAASTLAAVLQTAPTASLAPLAAIVARMPAAQAVPLLVRLSRSTSASEQAMACRYAAAFDDPAVRRALSEVTSRNSPGSDAWLYCMLGRARLGEPDTRGAVWGYGHTLQGAGQIYAAQILLDLGDDSGVQMLTELTHRGAMRDRLSAAVLLIDRAPDAAIPVIDDAERDADPNLRADALDAERRLRRTPSIRVRAMLADTAELVQIRAAEVVLDWAARQQKH
jgi:hypothetical protein